MATYIYKARDKTGALLTASIDVDSEEEAAATLRAMGYSVISIKPKKPELFDKFFGFWRKTSASRQHEVVFFSRQLATLLKSGISITAALSSLAEQTAKDKAISAAIKAVLKDIESGSSFSSALEKHPNMFSEVFVSMIKVGEVSGMLGEILDNLSQLNERDLEVRTRIKSAMLYPIILVTVAILVVSFLLVSIIPKFVSIFSVYEVRLPIATQVLLGVSFFVQKLWFAILLFVAVSAVALRSYIKTERGRYNFDYFLLRLPFFGQLYNKVIISQMARNLGTMVRSGVAILEALYVTAKTVKNKVVRKVIENVHASISEGQPLSQPFKASGLFPPTVVQMIALGEQTGKLDQMLLDVATFYDQEVDYTIKNLTTALEPVLLLGMGGIVAFIALSVLLPIFNLVKVFRH